MARIFSYYMQKTVLRYLKWAYLEVSLYFILFKIAKLCSTLVDEIFPKIDVEYFQIIRDGTHHPNLS